MKKRFWALMLTVIAAAVLLCVTACAADVSDLTYKITDGEVTITDCNTDASGDLTIPSAIEGYPVTDIGNCAFSNCRSLTKVVIPNSVTSMGGGVFYGCSALKTVTLPNQLTVLSLSSQYICLDEDEGWWKHFGFFEDCISLTNVTIPDSVTSIGSSAFEDCSSLTRVEIPDNVTSIGDYAFYDCTGLTSVTIGSGVTSISNSAFLQCSSLSQVNVDSQNSAYSSKNGVLYNKEKSELIFYPAGKTDESFTIPDSVTSIGSSAFEDCSSLTSVTIPDGVTSIGSNAFYGCSSLTSVTIPDSVTSIGGFAFVDCSSLTSITIPDGITSIDFYAFCGCSSLTSINIPDGITRIGADMFYDCSSLKNVTIPDSVTIIESGAFYGCSSLTDVYYTGTEEQWNAIKISSYFNDPLKTATIHYHFNPAEYLNFSITGSEATVTACNPAIIGALEIPAVYQGYPVTAIAEEAFAECNQMTSVTIPSSMKTIGKQAFLHCTGLTRVYITDLAAWCGMTFVDNPVDNAQHLYLNGELVTDLVIPEGVTRIAANAFYRGTCIKSVTLPSSLKTIESHAFFRCSGLTELKLPEGVTKVGKRAFYYCTGLETVTMPKSVTTITSGAFAGCGALTDVYYNGTEAAWSKISIGTENEPLTSAAIHYALVIKTQPKAATIAGSSTATFKVAATGDGLKYQWQYKKPDGSWTNCTSKTTGYNKATLKVAGVTGSTNRNGYQYRCKVTDSAGNTVTSSAATLTVKVLKITTQPTAASVKTTAYATFKVVATGDGLKYQWQYKKPDGSWTNCTSATTGYNTATLKVKGVTGSTNRNGYQYRCIITDSAGSKVTSSAVKLSVFAITTQPKAASVSKTGMATFKVAATGSGLKYQWQFKTPSGDWKNCTSATTGYNTATLKVKGASGSTNRNGYQYRCVIIDGAGNKLTTSAVKLTVK